MGQAEQVLWSDVDIEKDRDGGWWVVTLGVYPNGAQEKIQRRLFQHCVLDPGLARWAAHLLAFHIAETEGLRYLS